MRIAFYAPLKSPTHATPSGDRLVARLLMKALQLAGHQVDLVSSFRSFDATGDHGRQIALRDEARDIARGLAEGWRAGARNERPELWFTYHLYYKAPDWLGTAVSESLGIPYVLAEASIAPKRAGGRWATGHEAVSQAVRQADLLLSPTRDDVACLEAVIAARERVELLPPFLDGAAYRKASAARGAHRARIAAAHALDTFVPWIVVAAMMRPGDKLASYRMLAAVMRRVMDLPWQLVVAGDGEARPEIEALFSSAAPGRALFMGERSSEELAEIYSACDLCVWPAINEAYGMAMLEAQAAGLPVIACAARGVPEVVCDGRTGLLAPQGDDQAMAALIRTLLLDPERRAALGAAAADFVAGERSIEAAALRLDQALAKVHASALRRQSACPGE